MKKKILIILVAIFALGANPKQVYAISDNSANLKNKPYDVLVKVPCNIKGDEEFLSANRVEYGIPKIEVKCRYGEDVLYRHFTGTGNLQDDLNEAERLIKEVDILEYMLEDDVAQYYANSYGNPVEINSVISATVQSIQADMGNELCDSFPTYVANFKYGGPTVALEK